MTCSSRTFAARQPSSHPPSAMRFSSPRDTETAARAIAELENHRRKKRARNAGVRTAADRRSVEVRKVVGCAGFEPATR